MPADGSDPRTWAQAAQVATGLAGHAALAAVGVGAALLRLATYTGPPRPWRLVLLDGTVMTMVAFGVAEIAAGLAGSVHTAIGAGLASGLIGWEAIKRLAAARAEKGE